MEPPGWITDFIPFFDAISTQSGKGKKASLAITAPSNTNLNFFALSIAWFKASTLEVWPVPDEISWLFFANTIVLDLVCLHILDAKSKSSISDLLGFFSVTIERCWSVSVIRSLSCNSLPFRQVLTLIFEKLKLFNLSIILFFFDFNISNELSS